MYDTILVPTDGSEISTAAGEAAIALARQCNASVEVIYVLEHDATEPEGGSEEEPQRQFARDALSKIERNATDTGVDLTTTVVEPPPSEPVHQSILGFVDSNGIDAILMGTHGRTGVGRMVLGSVTEQTLRTSPVPVITLHEGTVFEPAVESVLVPTDGSDTAEAALEHGIALALAADAALHIINVVDMGVVAGSYNVGDVSKKLEDASNQALESAAQRAADADVPTVETAALTGVPDRSICEYAQSQGVDSIVMGTHGRTGVERFLLGSVTERVVRRSTVPVVGIKGAVPDESETV